jgi:phage gpG-like protein
MLAFTHEIQFNGFDQQLTATLERLSHEALEQAAAELRRRELIHFLTEGAVYAPTPWKPRKPLGPLAKTHRPLLFQTGRLRASLTDETSADHIEEIIPDRGTFTLIFGTRTPYAPFHQYGTRFIPARPLLTEEILSDL